MIIELQQIRSEYCMQLLVWTLNNNYGQKGYKVILYHVDISRRHFFVCHLKIAFHFLHELKQRSSDISGQHYLIAVTEGEKRLEVVAEIQVKQNHVSLKEKKGNYIWKFLRNQHQNLILILVEDNY